MWLWGLLLAVFSSLASLAPTATAAASGPLRKCPANPRYFCDAAGKAVLLAGSHTWNNFQDIEGPRSRRHFDYDEYLDFLRRNNHNFFRLWVWEQGWEAAGVKNEVRFSPLPYRRNGPGIALDGVAKFDLDAVNDEFFLRLRARVAKARDRGVYVSIMLFNGWSVDGKQQEGGNPWRGHPFNRGNNKNGIDGDASGTGFGLETHTLRYHEVTRLQEAYVRRVIDTLNDLDNVLWEISNESPPGSEEWHYHFISFIKEYESRKPHQHPVGMTAIWPGGDNRDLARSPADWISPNEWGSTSYKDDPPAASGDQVIITDTDHLWGIGGTQAWAWKSFLRGLNPIFMDAYRSRDLLGDLPAQYRFDAPDSISLRRSLGYIRTMADRLDLGSLMPRDDLSSTGYLSLIHI